MKLSIVILISTMFFVVIFVMALPNSAFAGDRGFRVAFIDISLPPYRDGKELALQLRHTNNSNIINCFMCSSDDDSLRGISVLVINKIPVQLTTVLAKKALSRNEGAISELKAVLQQYSDESTEVNGLDGVYFYQHDAKGVTVYAMSSKVKKAKFTKSFHAVSRFIKLENLDSLFRMSSKAFWNGFVP